MKLGIYSGTFDPIHIGHIAFAKQCLMAGLDQIVFMPEPEPRRKTNVTSLKLRLAMIGLATEDYSNMTSFAPDDHKNHSPAETQKLLVEEFGADSEFTLLLGGDVFEHVPNWHGDNGDIRNLDYVRKFKYMVGLRTEDDGETAVKIKNKLGLQAKLIVSDSPSSASRKIRRAIMLGVKAEDLDPKVEKYIKENNLYVDNQ